MKKWLLLIVLGAAAQHLLAAEEKTDITYWKGSGVAGINLSQVSLTNWAAGGEGSIAFDLLFNYSLDYKSDRKIWQNRLELAYGLSNTSSKGTRKTNDKIYLSSIYGRAIAKNLYASALLDFNTQFAKGYDYSTTPRQLISNFVSPAYLNVGIGLTWIPKKWFTATLTPFTWRGTFVANDSLSREGAFGVKPGKHLSSGFGGNLKLEVTYEFLPNMSVYSRLDLFSDYLHKAQNIDVRWDTQINMKINKWFAANISFNLIYDDDVKIPLKNGGKGPRVQFKEVLGIGFQVSF